MTARRDRLARRRKSLGFSQERLAVTLGVDRTTVGRWERGETDPHPYIRARLSGALQVTSAELDTLITGGPDHGNLPPAPHTTSASTADPMGEPDDMHRRELLRLLSVATVTVALPGEASTTSGGGWRRRTSTSTRCLMPTCGRCSASPGPSAWSTRWSVTSLRTDRPDGSGLPEAIAGSCAPWPANCSSSPGRYLRQQPVHRRCPLLCPGCHAGREADTTTGGPARSPARHSSACPKSSTPRRRRSCPPLPGLPARRHPAVHPALGRRCAGPGFCRAG